MDEKPKTSWKYRIATEHQSMYFWNIKIVNEMKDTFTRLGIRFTITAKNF